MTGNPKLPATFFRFNMGTSGHVNNNITNPTNLGMNTATFVCDPIVGKLDKFKVKFVTNTGDLYTMPASPKIAISLTAYTKRNKYSRI